MISRIALALLISGGRPNLRNPDPVATAKRVGTAVPPLSLAKLPSASLFAEDRRHAKTINGGNGQYCQNRVVDRIQHRC